MVLDWTGCIGSNIIDRISCINELTTFKKSGIILKNGWLQLTNHFYSNSTITSIPTAMPNGRTSILKADIAWFHLLPKTSDIRSL
jgi:hypothetical protein